MVGGACREYTVPPTPTGHLKACPALMDDCRSATGGAWPFLTLTQNNVISLKRRAGPGLATSEPYHLVSQQLRPLAKVGNSCFFLLNSSKFNELSLEDLARARWLGWDYSLTSGASLVGGLSNLPQCLPQVGNKDILTRITAQTKVSHHGNLFVILVTPTINW